MKSKIDTLLQKEEGKQLEFKRDLTSSKKLMKTIVAFANSSGGTVVIGVEDGTKSVVGIENILDEEERLSNIIADSISTRIVPNVEIVSIEEIRRTGQGTAYDELPMADCSKDDLDRSAMRDAFATADYLPDRQLE